MHLRLLSWSLRYRRRRHFLNATTMAITVAVVVLFASVVLTLSTFKNQSSRGRVLVYPIMQGGSNLTVAAAQQFSQIDGVLEVQCVKSAPFKVNGVGYMMYGEGRTGIEKNQDLLPTDPATVEAWMNAKPTGAIVTETVSKELNLPIGKEAELQTSFGPLKIKVAGISKGGMQTRRMALHFDYLNQVMGNDNLCGPRVFADPKKASMVANEIVERTRNSATPTQTLVDSEYAANWVKRVARIPTLLGFLGLFLALTTTLTLANSAAIAIRERRIEMASLRVMGFIPRTVAIMLLGEAVLVGLIGGIIGVGAVYLAVGDGFALTGAGQTNILGDVALQPLGVVFGLLLSVLVPLAGALPATIASIREPLVSALRDAA